MMNCFFTAVIVSATFFVTSPFASADDPPASPSVKPPIDLQVSLKASLTERDAFWVEVSRTVGAGDFEGYVATCHPTGVLVSGIANISQPLATALKRWKPEFADTKSGAEKAQVEFRFSKRLADETTAHETGIFHYFTVSANGERKDEYIHFEVLLLKDKNLGEPATWKTMMEFQKSKATLEEWEALKPVE